MDVLAEDKSIAELVSISVWTQPRHYNSAQNEHKNFMIGKLFLR